MRRVNAKLLELLAMPGKRSRLDVSTHPFTSAIARNDVRVTTRYEGKDFSATMFSVIHECGHALYELQIDSGLDHTPIGGGVTAGLHESQSRFWENIIGRSGAFISLVYPTLKQNLGFLSGYNEQQLYAYFNMVNPSMIRVDADELTYNFHIALRYDIERKLLDDKISVSELPSIWNDTMQDYLGIRPKNDAEGVLQDIHWAGGAFGIFPGYTIGNIVAGMLWSATGDDGLSGPGLDQSRILRLESWLQEKIHRWGATYPPMELLQRTFNKGYDADSLVRYLEQKYLSAN